jgi:hypothetical protein
MLCHVALVSKAKGVSQTAVSHVAAAVQKQVLRDFGPIWNVQASVDSFPKVENVPLGAWTVMVLDDIHDSALGYHVDTHGQPYALVKHTDGWEQTVSHEILEMLADPFGNRVVAAQSVKPSQGRVRYLVEVCDPSEDASYGYTVNGLLLSDFYTPHFFDPVRNKGVRYSFTGAITAPLTILRGGYLTWLDPVSKHMWQQVWFGSRRSYRDLGPTDTSTGSLRAHVDRATVRAEQITGVSASKLKPAKLAREGIERSSAAWAKSFLGEVERVAAGHVPRAPEG